MPKALSFPTRLFKLEMSLSNEKQRWPKAVLRKSEKAALAQAFDYYESVVSSDIKRVDDVDRDEELAKRIMRSYARNQASQATAGTI